MSTCVECDKTEPRALFLAGCISCEGRALAMMRFKRDELEGKHSDAVIAAFEEWLPIVKKIRLERQ